MPKGVVLIVAIAAFIAAGLILLLSQPSATSQPAGVVSPLGPSATPSIQTSAASSTAPLAANANLTASTSVDTLSWNTCQNNKYGYEIKYPSDWKVWTKGPGEAVLGRCDEDLQFISWGPDIYSSLRPPHLDLYLEDASAHDNLYSGKSLDEFLALGTPKLWGQITKESVTIDGERLVWFENHLLLSFHSGTFFEFHPHGIDERLLEKIMSTLRFTR
jgi:hypothetical protein